ncbi:MAG: efflux RND transporter periplasmic adaptor subunit [Anaerolineae bacterium]|nr:efflux RND transporter periplasmic adaptor subunit [Anaerolineae bacterium]
MRRRTIYVIVGLALVAVVGGALVWRSRSGQQAEGTPTRSAIVEQGSMLVAVTATGRIKPAARVGLTFEAPGRVAEIFVEEGHRVSAGEPLARLVADELELQVAQSQSGLTAAESQLAQLQAGSRPKEIEQAEANLRAAEAQLRAATANWNRLAAGPTEAEIASAEAQVAQASTNREIAQDTYDQIEKEGTEKEQANYDLYTAKQELAAAEARLEDVISGASQNELRAAQANVTAAAAQRDAAQAQLDQRLAGATEEDIAEAAAQVEQARIALELAEHALSKATLRAPFEGLVTEINMTPGEVPPTREQPLVLLDVSTFHITVAVDELDISQLEEGQQVDVAIEALPEANVKGAVETISPAAAFDTGVVAYDVVINLDPTEAPLRADMTANATVIVEELTDVLKIPAWAVRVDRDTGGTYVHRRTGEGIERVDVKLGARHEGTAQVISGLSPGDEVVRLEDSDSFSFGPQ